MMFKNIYIIVIMLVSSCVQDPAMIKYGGDKFFGYTEALEGEYKPAHTYPSSVIAKPKMSIKEIAAINKVEVMDIMQINNIKAEDFIFNDETRIYLPNYIIHNVKTGEDIFKISVTYGISIDFIKSHNALPNNLTLKPGQKLKIYVKRKSHFIKKDINHKHSSKPQSNKTQNNSSKQIQHIKPSIKANINPHLNQNNKASSHPEVINKIKSSFIWPVKGKIISPFGKLDKGVKNTGINILSRLHIPIIATQSGEVVFAGSNVPGFGKLIIIKHPKGWHSSYGHQHDNAVSIGEKVKKGDVIGYVGKTGSVKEPQLFFSLQKNKKPVDPLRYLP